MRSSSWVEIDQKALKQNVIMFQRAVRPAAIMPIIKSNAYGHGLIQVSQVLKETSIWGVGVAGLAEGLAIKSAGFRKPIVVLSYVDEDVREALSKKISIPIYSLKYAKKMDRLAAKYKTKALVHLNLDSGGTRLGLTHKDFLKLAQHVLKLKNIKVEGVYSWLNDSEEPLKNYTNNQLKVFGEVRQYIETQATQAIKFHVACTAASLNYNKSHQDISRLGIGLYGLWPSAYIKESFSRSNHWFKLIPVLSWHTRVLQVKNVPANTYISYGRTYKTKRAEKIAILPIGYWDGLDRSLSNRGAILINGNSCPIRGRICMNLTMVDVSKAGKIGPGDKATIIGQQKSNRVRADQLATSSNTINYEVVTRINPTIPRLLV